MQVPGGQALLGRYKLFQAHEDNLDRRQFTNESTETHCSLKQDRASEVSFARSMSSHLIDTSEEEDCVVAVALYISDLLDEGQVICPPDLHIKHSLRVLPSEMTAEMTTNSIVT